MQNSEYNRHGCCDIHVLTGGCPVSRYIPSCRYTSSATKLTEEPLLDEKIHCYWQCYLICPVHKTTVLSKLHNTKALIIDNINVAQNVTRCFFKWGETTTSLTKTTTQTMQLHDIVLMSVFPFMFVFSSDYGRATRSE